MKNRHFGRGRGITADAGDATDTSDLYNDPEFMALEGYLPTKRFRRPGHLGGTEYWFNRPTIRNGGRAGFSARGPLR